MPKCKSQATFANNKALLNREAFYIIQSNLFYNTDLFYGAGKPAVFLDNQVWQYMMIITAITIFTGSFLLFLVQPMLGQALLPEFGGSSAVWSVCLASYTIMLLFGYFYAYVLASLPMRRQIAVHLTVLFAATIWACSSAIWLKDILAGISLTGLRPEIGVMATVAALIGWPYVALSAGSTLVQNWTQATSGKAKGDVYYLYAISNLGSFLGLWLYPTVLGPYVHIGNQWRFFAVSVAVYFIFMVATAVRGIRLLAAAPRQESDPETPSGDNPWRDKRIPLWFLLPCLTSFILLSVTNQFTINISPLPLMWAGLLGAFLLSYTVGFTRLSEKALPALMVVAGPALAVLAWTGLPSASIEASISSSRSVWMGIPALFLLLTFFHAWLYSLRPLNSGSSTSGANNSSSLPLYYMLNAVGGAVGGAVAGAASTMIFDRIAEFPISIVASAIALVFFVWYQWPEPTKNGLNQATMAFAVFACYMLITYQQFPDNNLVRLRARDFYGITTVMETFPKDRRQGEMVLIHGATNHGVQRKEPSFRDKPTAYYGQGGGGIAFATVKKEGRRIAIVGMGVGVMAVYAQPTDYLRFFEISPSVISIATNTNLFTYLSDSHATIDIVEGDGRKRLESEQAEEAEKYDIIIIDTFSGDSIPAHMATVEAFTLYRDRLAPGGIIAFHISNWQFDLYPLCKALMEETGMVAQATIGAADVKKAQLASYWTFFSEEPLTLEYPVHLVRLIDWSRVPNKPPLTDDFGSMLRYRNKQQKEERQHTQVPAPNPNPFR